MLYKLTDANDRTYEAAFLAACAAAPAKSWEEWTEVGAAIRAAARAAEAATKNINLIELAERAVSLSVGAGEIEHLTTEKEALVYLVAGFVWAEACTLLDSAIDPRTYEIPNVIAKVNKALGVIDVSSTEG